MKLMADIFSSKVTWKTKSIKDIKWIEALGDYVKLVTEENSLSFFIYYESFWTRVTRR
jgi:hypothetical protein